MIGIPRDTRGAGPSWLSRTIGAMMAQFSREPGRYASLVTRRAGEAMATEAVVLLQRTTLALAPAFSHLPAGRYAVCVTPIAAVGAARDAIDCPTPTEFSWDSTQPGTMKVTGLRPGLHELRVRDRQMALSIAWVLVVTPSRFAEQREAFERVQLEAARWQEQSLPQAAAQLLRAHLAALAQPGH